MPFFVRFTSIAGAPLGQGIVARALIGQVSERRLGGCLRSRSSVRLRMNTGLPRHITVMAWPSLIGARSTSMEASAWVEASGFICWMSGQSVAAAPTAANEPAATIRKSRRVGSSVCAAKASLLAFSVSASGRNRRIRMLTPNPARAGGSIRQAAPTPATASELHDKIIRCPALPMTGRIDARSFGILSRGAQGSGKGRHTGQFGACLRYPRSPRRQGVFTPSDEAVSCDLGRRAATRGSRQRMTGDRQHGSLLRVRGGHEHGKVTFVELFFDLVFVFAVTQLSHLLLAHLTPSGASQTCCC